MVGLSLVKIESKSVSLSPCGCSVCGSSSMRSMTLTTRILLSMDEHRGLAMGEDLYRLAAEDNRGDAMATVRGHDD
jgi:hypothetical protein